MSLISQAKHVLRPLKPWLATLAAFVRHPVQSLQVSRQIPWILRGRARSATWTDSLTEHRDGTGTSTHPLRDYFDANTTGRGIWKWDHYLDLYERHLGKFVGKGPQVAEIGVYSGGSLEMWHAYFGPACQVYGIDIEEACRVYERAGTRIFIGDQGEQAFWQQFKAAVPRVDVVIDDGGHGPDQQRVTLEEMLPHLQPGGVYICEDIHGVDSAFAAYVYGLADRLHEWDGNWGDRLVSRANRLQSAIASVHVYPFAVVIEKLPRLRAELRSRRQGTDWQPFL